MKFDGFRNLRAMATEALLLLLCVLLFGVVLALPIAAYGESGLTQEEQMLLLAWQRGELIRLHILANSDQPEDQQLKLKVRDAILRDFGAALAQAGNAGPEQAYALLCDQVEALQATALRCAEANGYQGPLRAEAGLLMLPEKRYGRVLLPAGEYKGLRIVLGAGQGENWWCVLFPSLCLSLAEQTPWQAEPANAPEPAPSSTQAPEVYWAAERILACWPIYSPTLSPEPIATHIVDPESCQGSEHPQQQ